MEQCLAFLPLGGQSGEKKNVVTVGILWYTYMEILENF